MRENVGMMRLWQTRLLDTGRAGEHYGRVKAKLNGKDAGVGGYFFFLTFEIMKRITQTTTIQTTISRIRRTRRMTHGKY